MASGYDIPDMEMRLDHFLFNGPGSRWTKTGTLMAKYVSMKLINAAIPGGPKKEGDVGERGTVGPT